MPLHEYHRKRDFAKTLEPAGIANAGPPRADSPPPGPASAGRYVVQRHRASRLHYDFRLEVGGVLVSWAVPRGPTLDPDARRMAIHVEDHPVEYFDFEGVIPPKQYGAGDVIVWDWGTWEAEAPTADASTAIPAGELKFRLDGQKLRGRFTIVRTSGRKHGPDDPAARAFEDDEGDQWLLIHKRDEHAVKGWDAEDHPQSVKTGRTNDEVKTAQDALWLSEAPEFPAAAAAAAEIDLSRARVAPMPTRIEPMLATLASKPFSDPDWLFEIKWDGYRVQALVRDGTVRILTRNMHDAETYFPKLLSPPAWIAASEAIVDGEVVALDDAGRPDFGLLQERLGKPGAPGLVYQAFDLLYLDGQTLLDVPLEDRKRLLERVLRDHPRVRYAAHIDGEGLAFHAAAASQGLEGVVAKRRTSRYEPGKRSSAWLKLKIRPEQEFVVGGWTPGEGNASELGAVVVGVYEGTALKFAGKVGSGFDDRSRRMLRERLAPLELGPDDSPFDPAPPRDRRGRWGGDLASVVWVRPELVIRVETAGWSRDGMVRQAAFKGLEEGRDPLEVTREVAIETSSVVKTADDAELSGRTAAGRMSPSHRRWEISTATERAPAQPTPTNRPRAMAAPMPTPAQTAPAPAAPAPVPAQPTPANRPRAMAGRSVSAVAPAAQAATDDELAALETLGKEGTWHVGGIAGGADGKGGEGGRDLKLTNLDKPLFRPATDDPGDTPITKRELIRYFARIAPVMLPHLANRPLNLQRFPNGADAPGFWQKDIPATAPGWLTRWREEGLDGRTDRSANEHLIADGVAALCWLGNQASFEIHAWTGRLPRAWSPTFALIDIDPGETTTWDETLVLARLYRTALGHLGVRGYPKTTGKRGIQVWIPIVPRYSFEETSRWVERVSRAVGATVPDLVSWEWARDARKGKTRLDYTQNASIKTLVAPYAVRPARGAPVSAPIAWDELDDPDLRPDRWTIRTILDRVDAVGDLFARAQTDVQELPAV